MTRHSTLSYVSTNTTTSKHNNKRNPPILTSTRHHPPTTPTVPYPIPGTLVHKLQPAAPRSAAGPQIAPHQEPRRLAQPRSNIPRHPPLRNSIFKDFLAAVHPLLRVHTHLVLLIYITDTLCAKREHAHRHTHLEFFIHTYNTCRAYIQALPARHLTHVPPTAVIPVPRLRPRYPRRHEPNAPSPVRFPSLALNLIKINCLETRKKSPDHTYVRTSLPPNPTAPSNPLSALPPSPNGPSALHPPTPLTSPPPHNRIPRSPPSPPPPHPPLLPLPNPLLGISPPFPPHVSYRFPSSRP